MALFDYFISYSSKDKQIAFNIVAQIESLGYTCWIAPRNITYGTAYANAIMNGIDQSENFIVLVTDNSIVSEDVLNEVDNAHALKKIIIPIRLSDVNLSREFNYYLSRKQWINLKKADIGDVVSHLGIQRKPDFIDTHDIGNKQSTQTLIERLRLDWKARNSIINICLLTLSLFVLIEIIVSLFGNLSSILFLASSILGALGVLFLFLNKEDGFVGIFSGSLFFVLGYAYHLGGTSTPPLRYFKEVYFLFSYFPLIFSILFPSMLLITKRHRPWYKICQKISITGIIGTTITGIFWLWIIYFDNVTRLGLCRNVFHYINALFT